MTAIPIRIADAVVSEINQASFSVSFTAQRSYADWDESFEDADEMMVDVVFVTHQRADAVELSARGKLRYQPQIDIAIRKRFGADARDANTGRLNTAVVDPLVALLEEIHEFFIGRRNGIVLTDETLASWDESDVMSWVSQRKLRKGLFEGVVRITFDYTKAI